MYTKLENAKHPCMVGLQNMRAFLSDIRTESSLSACIFDKPLSQSCAEPS